MKGSAWHPSALAPTPPACPPQAKVAKLCRDTTGQLSLAVLHPGSADTRPGQQGPRIGTSSHALTPAVQLSSCSPAPSCFRVDAPRQRGVGQVSERGSAGVWATGEEEEPWVQAAHWPAARRRPRLVCHGQQAGLAPAQAPRKAGASLDSGIRSPDRMARPQEGALSQGKAGPRGAALDQPGPRVARGPEVKHRPFKAGPPWAWEHICPEQRQSDRQTDRQTTCLGGTDSGSGDLLLVWS